MKKIAIIGGGAAGMTCAVMLARKGCAVTLFERGARLGRKLSATGNGQGNLTNINMGAEHYFSDDNEKVARALSRFGANDLVRFLEEMGGIYLPDERGRVYPCGRQASAVTDLLRREIARLGVQVHTDSYIEKLGFRKDYELSVNGGTFHADAVVLAAGGKAAENFGTDGNAYALAKAFGHAVTPLSPVLVQLRCSPNDVRGLKGIRIDGALSVIRENQCIYRVSGDVLFADAGISGDAVFRASSYCVEGDTVLIDLLPRVSEERLRAAVGDAASEERLLCLVNNGLARVLFKRAAGDREKLVRLLKNFPVTVTGTLGFARAQVTRGGIPLRETDENFMSVKRAGLYFAGEILNADGECGGYNLQWAFTTAYCVSEGIL